MDSLTQIVLGAAVGEAALGKKIGNRAMIWGAIAGTIPDLDIIGNLFMKEIDALAFHRGISHSLFFAVLFSFLIAWYCHQFYKKGFYKNKAFRIISSIIGLIFMGFGVMILGGISAIGGDIFQIISFVCLSLIALYFGYRMYKFYIKPEPMELDVSYKDWYKLFFLTIVTHPFLDCHTSYGTQLFAPFSDYRVAFNNISVADPMYTFPFMVFIIAAGFYNRKEKMRRYLLWAGIGISSLYMVFTLYNKSRVDTVVQNSIETQELNAIRYMHSPSILNNILWSTTVETDSAYYQGQYSFFDASPNIKFNRIPKNHYLLKDQLNGNYTIDKLKWFSNDYFAVMQRADGRLQINDLRFGTFNDKTQGEDDYIFSFILDQDPQGNYILGGSRGGPPREQDMADMATQLWNRIKGKKI